MQHMQQHCCEHPTCDTMTPSCDTGHSGHEEAMSGHQPFQLLSVQQVPEHHKEISIYSGYRKRLEYQDCIKSIFKLHNETVNIWTHLLGFLIFFCLMLKDLMWQQEHIRDSSDYTATVIQLLTYQVSNTQHHY